MGLLRRRSAEAAPPPEPPARKSRRGRRTLKRLLVWVAPVAIQAILHRRKGGSRPE